MTVGFRAAVFAPDSLAESASAAWPPTGSGQRGPGHGPTRRQGVPREPVVAVRVPAGRRHALPTHSRAAVGRPAPEQEHPRTRVLPRARPVVRGLGVHRAGAGPRRRRRAEHLRPERWNLRDRPGAAFHGEIRDESGNVVQQRTRGFFGWVEATIVTLVDSTQLRVAVPVHAPGTVDVVVQNPNGRSATLPGGFTYSAETSAPRTPRSREPGVSNSPTRPRTRPTTRLPLHLSSGWRFVRGEAPAAEVASVRRFQRIAPGRRRLHPGER